MRTFEGAQTRAAACVKWMGSEGNAQNHDTLQRKNWQTTNLEVVSRGTALTRKEGGALGEMLPQGKVASNM